MELLILLLGVFLMMWVLVVLPQRRRQAAHGRMIADLEVGDEVVTAGGLYGDVTEIGEDEVALEIAPGVEVRVASRAVAAVVPPDAYEEETDQASAGQRDHDAPDGSPDGSPPRESGTSPDLPRR